MMEGGRVGRGKDEVVAVVVVVAVVAAAVVARKRRWEQHLHLILRTRVYISIYVLRKGRQFVRLCISLNSNQKWELLAPPLLSIAAALIPLPAFSSRQPQLFFSLFFSFLFLRREYEASQKLTYFCARRNHAFKTRDASSNAALIKRSSRCDSENGLAREFGAC